MMDNRGCEFFIRATAHEFLWEHIKDVHHWEPITYGTDSLEIAEFNFIPFVTDKSLLGTHFNKHRDKFKQYRIVVTRRPHFKGEINKNTGDAFVYRSIITNNWDMSKAEVLATYNERGTIEQGFDMLNNDWNWSCIPFSYLKENATFLIISAMGLILYQFLKKDLAKKVDFVTEADRLKKFRYNFISIPAEWQGETLIIYDDNPQWKNLISA